MLARRELINSNEATARHARQGTFLFVIPSEVEESLTVFEMQ